MSTPAIASVYTEARGGLRSRPFTVPQFSRELSQAMQFPVTKHFIYRMARDGRIEHVRLGRRVLIPREQLQATVTAWLKGEPW